MKSFYHAQSRELVGCLPSMLKAAQPIPKGLCLLAQGCEERATLGNDAIHLVNPNGVALIRSRLRASCRNPFRVILSCFARSRVARGLATLGFAVRIPLGFTRYVKDSR